MEQSPLELYEAAYKLHYVENRISDALIYYQKLIEVFPESNECGYASIQIQKIKAESIAREIKKAGKFLHPVSIIAFIIGILSFLLSGAFAFLLNQKVSLESRKSGLAINALAKMYRGEDEEALKILTELKIISSHDITPFELTSEVFRKRKDYHKAKEEYTLYFKVNPKVQPTEYQRNSMLHLDVLVNSSGNKRNISTKTESSIPARK